MHKFGMASESLFRRIQRVLRQRQRDVPRPVAQGSAAPGPGPPLPASPEQLWRAVLGGLHEGIILQDLNGKVTLMNRAAQTMLGSKKAFWSSELGALFERYRGLTRAPAELTPLGETGELALNHRVLRASLAAIGDSEQRRIGSVIILRDVTHDALAQRLKDGFVAHIAGRMDQPLSVIKLAGELLDADAADAALNRRLLSKLLGNVDLLDQLALELQDIAEMRAGSFDVQRRPVDVEGLVWAAVRGASADFAARDIQLLVMTRGIRSLRVSGDEARLQWALGHLLRNGAGYNDRGGWVALSARAAERGGKSQVIFGVADNGIGIAEADLPHIFQRSFRGDHDPSPTSGPARGLGQGLYVAREIGRAHGGDLQARSQARIGSAFTLSLPLLS